ncbi:hypothetical protein [Halalkalibacter akibai]|uniref:Uncharacterized protein n=1 Tax=Halalkalibacter akibai (strain ATCC 43226 / DSM 21942 / CIP 109018 / JCM 9157 / 1139) TaxID=1236973 RepID=W4QQP1_HALA3|nr:hypothetical protein [Halalkalibacter akibai]GAE33669.1 hypothetical protein JCM9157_689 [Halalkalibacter akibai JCM 9157]
MSKKLKMILAVTVILVGAYFIHLALKDDVQEINKAVFSLNQQNTNIAHIEFLDNKQAIAFYEWGAHDNLHFGSAIFKKNLLGWKFVHGSTGTLDHGYKLDWGFSNLEFELSGYTDLIRGKILDPRIVEVTVQTTNGNEFKANVIDYNKDEKFWFLVSGGEDLLGSTITGMSSDGEMIEQIIQ